MAEQPIRKYQPVRRASIVPVSSAAPEAPVMVAPGSADDGEPGIAGIEGARSPGKETV